MLSMRASPGGLVGVSPSGGTFALCNGLKLQLVARVPVFKRREGGNVRLRLRTPSLGLVRAEQKEVAKLVGSSEPGSHEFVDISTNIQKKNSVASVTCIASDKPRVTVIAGPTVGKTNLSIELAKKLGGEIINADSVQVYQGLDVGAAKIPVEERQGIPHHLMDLVPPTVEYTYEQFFLDSRAATQEILAKGLVPIVVGGTGMYMRWYMHNKRGITSHPFHGEDLTGELDGTGEDAHSWDYDFQCYFLYQHRADLYPRVDIRCERMVPALLEETSWLLDLGVEPDRNSAAKAIGYEEAMRLLLEARQAEGLITNERFLSFLSEFQHNSKDLVRKQIAWFRNPARSEVRKFRWIQAGGPVQHMVDALEKEYFRPRGKPTEISCGELLKAASLREGKRMQTYKPTFEIFSHPEAIASTLEWIKYTQDPCKQFSL